MFADELKNIQSSSNQEKLKSEEESRSVTAQMYYSKLKGSIKNACKSGKITSNHCCVYLLRDSDNFHNFDVQPDVYEVLDIDGSSNATFRTKYSNSTTYYGHINESKDADLICPMERGYYLVFRFPWDDYYPLWKAPSVEDGFKRFELQDVCVYRILGEINLFNKEKIKVLESSFLNGKIENCPYKRLYIEW